MAKLKGQSCKICGGKRGHVALIRGIPAHRDCKSRVSHDYLIWRLEQGND